MKIRDIINEEHAEGGPLYVAGRDFELAHESGKHKGYVLGMTYHDDDDVRKTDYDVYKFVRSEEFEWHGKKFKQDKYEYLGPVIDPKTGVAVSPYPSAGKIDPMFDHTVDGLISGSIKKHQVPMVTMPAEALNEDSVNMAPINIEKAKSMFGSETIANILKSRGSSVLFDRDKDGRNWKLVKLPDGTLYLERDFMLEGDSIIFEGMHKAVAGVILGMAGDAILIEGGTFPMIGPEDPPGEMETDLTDMPHRDEMLAISAEIWHLLQEVPDEYDTEDELNYLDDEARKLGYEPVIGIDPYPFLDINWHHRETDRYFKITPKYLKQDQRFRGTINESDAAKAITQAFGGMAAGVKTGLIRRAGLLAMQGRHSEAENTIRHLLKDLDAAVADKIRKSINDVKPVKVGDKIADTSAIEKSKAHTDWLDKTFVPWMEKLLGKKLDEAKYKGREVKLGKPMAGDTRKYKVYVRDPKTGNIKKVNFGDKGMEIKRDDPKRRKNFRARHGCGTPRASNRLKAAYWSCRMWSRKPVSKILKGK